MDIMSEFFKISVCIPKEFSEELMNEITKVISPMYPGYDRAFTISDVTGTWRTLEGSHPYNGKINEITVSKEVRIDFAIHEKDLKKTIETILLVHPYEEPGIDIVPMIGWKTITGPL